MSEEKRTERVTILLTPKEKEYIKKRAEAEKRTLSDHVRLVYLERVMVEALSAQLQRGIELKGVSSEHSGD